MKKFLKAWGQGALAVFGVVAGFTLFISFIAAINYAAYHPMAFIWVVPLIILVFSFLIAFFIREMDGWD